MLCRNSLVNRRCTHENCSFTHLKGTKRYKDPAQEKQKEAKSERRPNLTQDDFPPLQSTLVGDSRPITSNQANSRQADATNAHFLEKLLSDLKTSFDERLKTIEQRMLPAVTHPPPQQQNPALSHPAWTWPMSASCARPSYC